MLIFTVVYLSPLFQSHQYFYTYKNSQSSLENHGGLGSEQEGSDFEGQSGIDAIQQKTNTDTSNTSSGNQSAAIATVTILTVGVVVVLGVGLFRVKPWKKVRSREGYQLL